MKIFLLLFLSLLSFKGKAQNNIDYIIKDIVKLICHNRNTFINNSISDSIEVVFDDKSNVRIIDKSNNIFFYPYNIETLLHGSIQLPILDTISDDNKKSYDLCYFDCFFSDSKRIYVKIIWGYSYYDINDNIRKAFFEGYILFKYIYNKKTKKYKFKKHYIHYI